MLGVGPKLWSTSNETCASAIAAVASTPTAVVMVRANEEQRIGRDVIICPPRCYVIREPSPLSSQLGSRLHATCFGVALSTYSDVSLIKTETLLESWLATARSGKPSPLKSPTATEEDG